MKIYLKDGSFKEFEGAMSVLDIAKEYGIPELAWLKYNRDGTETLPCKKAYMEDSVFLDRSVYIFSKYFFSLAVTM